MKKNFKIKAKVWRWPGDMGWHFITIDKKISAEIRNIQKKGFVKIVAKIGRTTWETSLFPHKESQAYLLSIKKLIRTKEDIWAGDTINVSFILI